jgi:MinD-like ATPase involved in chromosome partitioning or flagellar assembly
VGVAGGVGATTVSAGLLAVLPDRVGGPVGLGDHVGGVLRARAADGGTSAPTGPLVSDLGPHASGDAEVLARIGDVVVIVAPLDPEGVRRGEAARRAIVERRGGDAGAAVLVVAESRPTRAGSRRRALAAARESARTVVIRWDPALADRRSLDAAAFSEATRSSFSELCDAIRS